MPLLYTNQGECSVQHQRDGILVHSRFVWKCKSNNAIYQMPDRMDGTLHRFEAQVGISGIAGSFNIWLYDEWGIDLLFGAGEGLSVGGVGVRDVILMPVGNSLEHSVVIGGHHTLRVNRATGPADLHGVFDLWWNNSIDPTLANLVF